MGEIGRVGGIPDLMERAARSFAHASDGLSGHRSAALRWARQLTGEALGDPRTTEAFGESCRQWSRGIAEIQEMLHGLGQEIEGVAEALRRAGS